MTANGLHKGYQPNYEHLTNADLAQYAKQWPNPRGIIGGSYNANDISRLLDHIACLEREGDLMLKGIQFIAHMPMYFQPDLTDVEKQTVLKISNYCASILQTLIDAGAIVPSEPNPPTDAALAKG